MASCRIRRTSYAALDPNFPQSTRSIRLQSSVGDASALHFNTCKVLKLRSDQTDSVSVDLHQQRLNGDGRLLFFGHTCDRLRSRKIKSRHSRILRHRRQSADSVEKLLFRSYSKNSRAAEASLLLGRGEPCNLLLRATRTVLTSAATIRRVNCREQRTLTRIRSMCILEFFNGIGHERS